MTQRVSEKGKGVDKSERSGMATHGMHNTTLSKPLVVHRVAWVWPVHHQEDGKSDVLDEGVEHHNGVGEVSGCHETMVCWSSLCGHPVSPPPSNHVCAHHGVCVDRGV
mgnify:FL=1